MAARRRLGPAALAAALLGAGLLLHRPRLVHELKPGPRGAAPAPRETLASPIAWPASAPAAAVPPSAPRAAATFSAVEEDAWRDAPADFRKTPDGISGAARAGAPRAPRAAVIPPGFRDGPSAAETDHVPVPAPPKPKPSTSAKATRAPGAPAAAWALPRGPALRRRVPLAKGPAAEGDEAVEDDGEPPAVDARRTPGPGDWRRLRRTFPLFRPPRRSAAAWRALAKRPGPRVRPLLLSKALGLGALRPPPASIVPPDLSFLAAKLPKTLPGGEPVPSRPLEAFLLENLDPRRAGASPDRKRAPHWDDRAPLWHDGPARGLAPPGRWQWLFKDDERWWAARPGDALLRHGALWWSKRKGVWFALHGGELWSWRRFSEWDSEGLMRLRDGVQLVYSADFSKVAVIEPGYGAVLYDVETGFTLGRWTEDELPRRRPRPPSSLRLPRGI